MVRRADEVLPSRSPVVAVHGLVMPRGLLADLEEPAIAGAEPLHEEAVMMVVLLVAPERVARPVAPLEGVVAEVLHPVLFACLALAHVAAIHPLHPGLVSGEAHLVASGNLTQRESARRVLRIGGGHQPVAKGLEAAGR